MELIYPWVWAEVHKDVVREINGKDAKVGCATSKGAIRNGYEFLGGDPSLKSNWRKVQS